MFKSTITPEAKAMLIEDFKNGMPIKELGAKYGLHPSSASKIAIRAGAAPRRDYSSRDTRKIEKTHNAKTCRNCKKTVDVKGARFCPYCGADIRTENEILIEKLNNEMSGLYIYLPSQFRDEYLNTLNRIQKALKEDT